jgi:hypothetical protein
MSMRFPTTNHSEPEPDADRRIHWYLGGGEVVTLRADRNEPVFGEPSTDVSKRLRAFNDPILAFQGRAAVRMPLEDTREYIGIVEDRLRLNAELLASYPALIEAQEEVVDTNQAKLQAAYAVVEKLVMDDQARTTANGQQWQAQGLTIASIGVVAPERWLPTQGCFVRDTDAWKRYEYVEARSKARSELETQAIQELTRLRGAFAEERQLTTQLESRLYTLRSNLE